MAAALLAAVVLLMTDPHDRPLGGDAAVFVHFGRRVGAGEVPYRDFFDHKTPLTSYFNAGAMTLGDAVGRDELDAMHDAYLLVGVAIALMLFGIGKAVFGSSVAGLGAVVLLLGYAQFGTWVATGSSPKLLFLAAGLLSWLAALHRRWAVAGLGGALAFLAWQPGLLFAGICGMLALVDARRSGFRIRPPLLLAAGFATPLLVLAAHYLVAGAASDAWLQVVVFNRDYVQGGARSPFETLTKIIGLQHQLFADQVVVWVLSAPALAAMCGIVLRRPRALFAGESPGPGATDRAVAGASLLLLAGLVILANLVNSGGQTDQVMFLPLLTLLPVALGVLAYQAAWQLRRAHAVSARALVGVILFAVSWYALADGRSERAPLLERQGRDVAFLAATAALEPDDPVLNLGAFTFAALGEFDNVAKYTYTYSGVPGFVADHEPAGLAYYRELAERTRPRLVLYERRGVLSDFNRWLESSYVRCDGRRIRRIFPPDEPHPIEVWLRPDAAERNPAC